MPRTTNAEDSALQGRADDFFANLHKALKTTDSSPSIGWDQVDESLLTAAIVSATEGGASLLFGRTSDGGALTLIIYGGKKPVKYYPVTAGGANELLDSIAAATITSKAGKRG